MCQAPQHGKADADRVGPRGQPFVRQRLPARKHRDRGRIQHARQRGSKIICFSTGRGHGEHRPTAPARECGSGERPQRSRRRQVKPELTDRGEGTGQGRISARAGRQNVQQRGEGHRCVPSLSTNGAILQTDTTSQTRSLAAHRSVLTEHLATPAREALCPTLPAEGCPTPVAMLRPPGSGRTTTLLTVGSLVRTSLPQALVLTGGQRVHGRIDQC